MPEPVIIKVGADLSELTAKLESIQSQLDEMKCTARKPGEELKKSFTGATGAMNDVKMSAKQLDNEIRAVTESMRKTNDPKAIAALKQYKQELLQEESALNKTQTATTSLIAEKRNLVRQMALLDIAGKKNSIEYDELTKKAGLVSDALRDANISAKNFGSDTRNIDGMIQGVQGLVGAFSIFQGVQMLVGSENKEFQKAMLKMMATMQILNGVQQVANILQKESALMQTVNAAKTKLLAIAQTYQATATGAATTAQWSLNAAMLANPIGIVIVAVAALAAGLIYFASTSQDAAIAQYKFNDALKENKKFIDESTAANDDLIVIMKARGDAQEAIIRQEISLLREQRDANKKFVEDSKANYKKLTDEQKKDYLEKAKSVGELGRQINKKLTELDALVISNSKKAVDIKLQNMADGYAKEIAIIEQRYKDEIFAAGSNADLIKQIDDKKNKDISTINKKYWLERIKTENENQNLLNNSRIKILEDGSEKEIAVINQSYLEQKQSLELKLKEDIKLNKKQRENINEVIKNLVIQQQNDEQKIRDKYLKEKLARDTEQLRTLIDIENKKNSELLAMDQFYVDNSISLEQKKNAELKLENDKYLEEKRQADINGILLSESSELKHAQKLIDIELQYQQEKTRIQQEEEQKRQEINKQTIDKTSEFLQNSLTLIMQFEKRSTDEKLKNIKTIYDNQIEKNQDALDKGLISRDQFDKKKKQLDEQQEKRIRDANRKAFNQQKAASLVQATIKGVVATLELVGQGGWAGLAAGLALIAGEIALIASAKNPYRAGTAQILNGNSHEGGGISLGQFGTAEGGEMLGILSKKNTKKFGKPMLELFDGINKGNDSKMMRGLSGLVISAMPEIKQGNQIVNVPKQPELSKMLQIMERPQETVTIIGNKKIIKQGNYTRIVHI